MNAAIDRAKRERKPVAEVNLSRVGGNILIKVGPGNGSGRLLLVGFDHEHTTKIGRGENRGRSLTEVIVVRSVRPIADWSGEALQLNERFPDGEDAADAMVLEWKNSGGMRPLTMFKAMRMQMDHLGFEPDYRIASLSALPALLAGMRVA